MSNITVKYNDIDFEQDVELCGCEGHQSFIYNERLLYFQTDFHESYYVPSSTVHFPATISIRSYVRVKMTPDMEIYHFYQRFDKFLNTDQFRSKLKAMSGFNSTKFEYDPIIKIIKSSDAERMSKYSDYKLDTLKYFLPYKKIRIGYPEGIDSGDHDTKMLAFCKSYDDKYYGYTSFNYKLFKNFNGIIQELPFDSFDEFTSYVKQGTNISFVVKPTLVFKKNYNPPYPYYGNKNSLIYFIRLDVSQIEIK